MNVAYVSALSALAGSVVGGLTTGVTTWLGLRAQARAGHLAREMSRRDDLYKDFIVAASRGPLRHDQQDARRLFAANCRVR